MFSYSYLRVFFVVLHIVGGHVGLPIIILIFCLSKNVKRPPTLVNFWITWVVYSVSYSLLTYSGHWQTKSHTPSVLCQIQSSLVHGATAMCAVAGLTVVAHTWMSLRDMHRSGGKNGGRRTTMWLAMALTCPYICAGAFALAVGLAGRSNPTLVDGKNELYCTVNLLAFSRYGVPVFCTIMLAMLVTIEVCLSLQVYRTWRHVSNLFPLAERKISKSLAARILLFIAYSAITLSASIVYLAQSTPWLGWSKIVEAAMPLVALLVFGTQKDLLEAACFWRLWMKNQELKRWDTGNSSNAVVRKERWGVV